jgi:hypothetical protein
MNLDDLMAQALQLAEDMRDDTAVAHRTVKALSRHELECLCCVLAAAFPIDQPLSAIAWWRFLDRGAAA